MAERSSNRGRCAQPCRLNYDLCGKKSGLINHDEGAHLLSTKDLNLITVLPELYQNGISGIKIEGRMKRPEYVATVVRIYREAIDRLLQTPEEYYVGADDLRQLEQIFNRDFTKGFLWNESGKKLMSLKRPNNRGVFIGRIVEIDPPKKIMRIKLEKDLSVGDGIEIWVSVGGRVGTTIEKMYVSDSERSDAYTGEIATIYAEGNFRVGDRVFRTHDEKLISTAQKTYIDVETARRIPLEADVKLRLGEPMILTLKDPKGNIVREESDRISEKASAYPMTEKQIEKQLERTGNTSFSINTYSWNIEPGLFMPVSIINELRRKAVNKMEALYAREYEPSGWNMAEKRLRSYLSQSPFRKGKEVKKVIPRLSVTVDE